MIIIVIFCFKAICLGSHMENDILLLEELLKVIQETK